MEISQEIVQEKLSRREMTQNQNSFNVKSNYKYNIVWKNVISLTYLHFGGLYALFLLFRDNEVNRYTIIWCKYKHFNLFYCLTCIVAQRTTYHFPVVGILSSMGVTAGAHRLWCHRSYKAKWPLRLYLMISQTLSMQNHIYEWVRDHRVHHKFTDTDADPHNARRGFFFSHVGWLMVRKHPDVIKKGATVDMSDLEKDPIVVFQRRWYYILVLLVCFVIPVGVPYYFWNEQFILCWNGNLTRYIYTLNVTWLVNSAAHIWGMKPYDVNIQPTENLIVPILACDEKWHNLIVNDLNIE
ncbi:acyl-CoA desaturase [Apis florea]|uniref:acyl-CoA desaturase n=1 Tax=Apis florea TaxID=7463 RepID=UPI0012FEEBCD|nr:acyl-CoA desaturase [Apis florea]